jgi:hypothetical protein
MKKPWLAFLLSFLLAGAGLWYLGRLWSGVINLLLVIAIGVGCAILMPEAMLNEWGPILGMTIPAASGVFAQQQAMLHNKRLAGESVAPA